MDPRWRHWGWCCGDLGSWGSLPFHSAHATVHGMGTGPRSLTWCTDPHWRRSETWVSGLDGDGGMGSSPFPSAHATVRGMGTVPRLLSWVCLRWHHSGDDVAVGKVDGSRSEW